MATKKTNTDKKEIIKTTKKKVKRTNVPQSKRGLIPLFNAHHFSVSEIFSNNNGKTSSTKIIGFVVSIVCLILFLMLVIYYFCNPQECPNVLQLIDRTVSYFTVSAGLMGVKSITSSFGKNKVELVDMSKVKTYNNKTSYYSQNQQAAEDTEEETEEIIEEETR